MPPIPPIPSGIPPAPPAPWYILVMMGLQMASSSFWRLSYSSLEPSWLPWSHWTASSQALVMAALSDSSSLPATLGSAMVFFMEKA